MFRTDRVSNGLFRVFWNDQETVYEIFNGYLGFSGHKNYYQYASNLLKEKSD